jgi:adenylosuccinate synthase
MVKSRDVIRSLEDMHSKGRGLFQAAGDRLDQHTSGGWLASWIAQQDEAVSDSAEFVIDAVRTSPQIEGIRERFGSRVVHVHLTASDGALKQRYGSRHNRDVDEMSSYEKVKANATERNIGNLAVIADLVINTERSTPEDVFIRVAAALGYFGRGTDRLVDVLVGGQYGSEGKGHITSYISGEYGVLVRVGGPNAGHSVYLEDSSKYAHHHLPSGTLHSSARLVLGPGATLYVPKLLREIATCKVGTSRLSIDPQAMIIEDGDRKAEDRTLKKSIASTAQGVGFATARKVLRGAFPSRVPVRLARDIPELRPFLCETRRVLDDAFRTGTRVLLEGTQGTGLSIHHGSYPHVTSRDTTVSGCLADAGIPPSRVRRIMMVCRSYPIRVQDSVTGQTSGPMSQDLSYTELSRRSGIPLSELKATETTTTTKRQRRLSEFDWRLFRVATSLNGPTDIALTFADYVRVENRQAQRFEQLTSETIRFIEELERVSGAPVSLISTRFGPRAIIDRRRWS